MQYYRLVLVLLVCLVSSNWAQANECSAVFPDGLQNNTTQGAITFGFNSFLSSSPDALLESSNQIIDNAGFPTCVNEPCTSSGTPALAVSYAIPGGGSGDATLTTSTTLAPGNYNNYQVNSGVTLTLSAGDYIFNDLTLISTSKIIMAGANDVVRIFVKDEASIGNNTQINIGGDPSNLLLYFSKNTTFVSDNTPNRSNTNAFIYSDADIKLGFGAKLTGAINAKNIDLISASSVIFDDTVPDFGDFCEPQQITPILEYRFDECGYTGDAGDVIDNTGIFNGTTTDILSPKLNGKINSSIDMASINSDPFKFITVPKEAIHDLDDFTLATWVKIPNKNGQRNQIISALGTNRDDNQLEFIVNNRNNGNDDVIVQLLGGGDVVFNAGQNLTNDTWHHLSITRQSGTVCLYINGQLQQCINNFNTGSLSITNNNAVVIGQEQDRFGSGFDRDQTFLGELDEFLVFDEVLTPQDMATLYSNQNAGNNYDASSRSIINCAPRLEAGRVTLKDTRGIESSNFSSANDTLPEGFSQVCFNRPFSEPPAVFTMPTRMAGTQLSNRVATRIRKVTTTGFQVTQVHSGNPTNTPSGYDSQEIDFIAVKKGNYQLGGGKAVVIGSESLTNHRRGPNPNNNVNATQSWLNVPFDLPGVPAVLATIQTMNNEFSDGPFPVSKPFMVANTVANGRRLQLALDQGETVANSAPNISSAEKIAYLAITPGSGLLIPPTESDIGVTYQAIRTLAEIRGLDLDDCKSYTIDNNTGNLPLVIAHKNSFSGTDGGWMERCAISNNSVSFSVTEDDFKDGYPGGRDDTNHINERAGILALTGNFADYTNSCGPSIDHFEINTGNAEGLTCEEDTITLKACANADCSVLSTDAVDVNFIVKDGTTNEFTKTVIIVGGQVVVKYRYTKVGDASLTLIPVDPQITNEVKCTNNASLSICDVDFKETGFRFVNGTGNQNLPVQLSGKPSNVGFNATTNLAIEAVTTDGNETPSCEALLVTTGQSIEMGAKYKSPAVAPGSGSETVNITGTAGKDVTLVNNADNYIYTQVPLDFGDNSQNSASYVFTYNNAGSILLNARYQLPAEGSNTSGDYITGTSNPIIVRPFAFDVQVAANNGTANPTANPAASDASGDKFIAAGSPMTVTTRAVAWASGNDINLNGLADQGEDISNASVNPTTTNFTASNASLVHSLVAPSVGEQGSLSGTFSGNFSNGKNTFVTSFSEVGIIDLAVNASNYLAAGVNIAGKAPYVGRFIPDHFTITKASNGELAAYCDSTKATEATFAYTGQLLLDDLSSGSLLYKFNGTTSMPVTNVPYVKLQARSAIDNITKNYTGSFNKLTLAGFTRITPTRDATKLDNSGSSGSFVSIIADLSSAQLSDSDGEITYSFSADDNFYYERNINTEVNPFNADLDLTIETIEDDDGVEADDFNGTTNNGVVTLKPSGVDIRFGRVQLENSYGPETSDLVQNISVNYFKDDQYILSPDDQCTRFNSSNLSLVNIDLTNFDQTASPKIPAIEPVVDGSFINGTASPIPNGQTRGKLLQLAAGNVGKVCIIYNADDWLKYRWVNESPATIQCGYVAADRDQLLNDNPFGVASFGMFRGNDRIIYQREKFD